MRLAVSLLTFTLFAYSNAEGNFPWKNSKTLLWQAKKPSSTKEPLILLNTHSNMSLTVYLSPNGAVKIVDRNGFICLRLGLPGRPKKVWRDSGARVADIFAPIFFPVYSPLQRNIDNILLDVLDFRSNLEGLLWIIDDNESILTIINPTTSQAVYLPLPNGQDLDLAFYPDRIEVFEDCPKDHYKVQPRWSLYWLTLMPNFIQLGKYGNQHQKIGTALAPFGKQH